MLRQMIWKKRWIWMALLAAAALLILPAHVSLADGVSVPKKAEYLKGGAWKAVNKDGEKTYSYKKSNGKTAKNGWKKISGYWYCMDENGYACTGLTKVNGRYFLFQSEGGAGKCGRMKTGLEKVGSNEYYFRASGSVGVKGSRVESEWVTIKGSAVYFKKDGTKSTQKKLGEKEFIKIVGKLAKADMQETGILASVTTAQAILESGYGSSSLAVEANNYFGMKATLSGNSWESEWDGSIFTKQTLEWNGSTFITITDDFRAYSEMAASIRDHSNYLRYATNNGQLRYKGVSGNTSYRETIQIIKDGGYATDPGYVTKICNLIKKYKLTKYDK